MHCLCSRSQGIVFGVLLGKGDPDGCGGGGGGGGRNSKDEMLGECEKKKKNEGEVAAGAWLKTRIEFALAMREGGKPV